MRRFLFCISLFTHFSLLHAAPVGNTAAPKLLEKGFLTSGQSGLNCRMGYEGDFVADGRMEQYDQGEGRVDTYEQWTNSGTFTLNIVDRLDIYGVFGSSKTKADWRVEDTTAVTVSRIKLETEESFLWAVGARAILYEWGNTCLGVGGRYSVCDYTPNSFSSDSLTLATEGAQCNWNEWQINLDLSYTINIFTPYIGVKHLKAETKLSGFPVSISSSLQGSNSFKNRVPVGVYIGCALTSGDYFMLNIEGRLVDEEAITLSGDLRF